MATTRTCKDCLRDGVTTTRPAPHPGPRCASHHRAVKKARRVAAHDTMVQRVYGLGHGGYAALYELQGGLCAGCRRATGATKRLAVDHNHATGEVRGLLCGVCNQLIGHFRDNPETFLRLADYLVNPPARRLNEAGIVPAGPGPGDLRPYQQ